jgi:hypothetical protein
MLKENSLFLKKIKEKSNNLTIKNNNSTFENKNQKNNIKLNNDYLSTKLKQYEKNIKKINLPKIKKYSNKINNINKLKYMNDKNLDEIFSFNENDNNFNGFYTNTDFNIINNKNKSFNLINEYNKNKNFDNKNSFSTNYEKKISKKNSIIKKTQKQNNKNSITFNSNNKFLSKNKKIQIKRFSILAMLAIKLENDLEDIDEYDFKVKVRDNFFKLKKLMKKKENKNLKLLNDLKQEQILNENMLKIYVVQLKNKHNFDYQKYKLQMK